MANTKTKNIVNAAGSLKNFDFDFGINSTTSNKTKTLESLKQSSPTPLKKIPSTPSSSSQKSPAPPTSPWQYISAPPPTPASAWSQTPIAQAGLVGSKLECDSLADLWNSTVSGGWKSPELNAKLFVQGSPKTPTSKVIGSVKQGSLASLKVSQKCDLNATPADPYDLEVLRSTLEGTTNLKALPKTDLGITEEISSFSSSSKDHFGPEPFSELLGTTANEKRTLVAESNLPRYSMQETLLDFEFGTFQNPQVNAESQADLNVKTFQNTQPSSEPFSVDFDFGNFQKPPKNASFGASPVPLSSFEEDVFSTFSTSNPSKPIDSNNQIDPLNALFGGNPAPATESWNPLDPLESLLFTKQPMENWTENEIKSSSSTKAPPNTTVNNWGEMATGGEDIRSLLEKGSSLLRSGQYSEAIDWLSRADVAAGDADRRDLVEVLRLRAQCLKEVGEMKRAISDCSRIIEILPENTVALMERARLYEATEKYQQAVQDLQKIVQLDSGNRQAATMLARLKKAAAVS